jgi:hypothetical protein
MEKGVAAVIRVRRIERRQRVLFFFKRSLNDNFISSYVKIYTLIHFSKNEYFCDNN